MPPDEEENKPLIIKVENIPSAVKTLAAVNAELLALNKSAGLINSTLDSGLSKSLGLANEINKLQTQALKDLGQIDFDAKINKAFSLFAKLNNQVNRFGVGLKDTVEAQRLAESAFIGTNRNVDALTRNLAANSKTIERSKLLPFQKDLAFQVGLTSEKIAQSANRMIGLDVAMQRPIGTMLGGVSKLSRGMATFGSDIGKLRRMAQTIELTEAQFGTRDFIRQGLERTFTREGRVRTFARLQQISSQLRAATGQGLNLDTRLLRQDPGQRIQALSALTGRLADIGPGLPENLRRALAAVVAPASGFGQEATQRILMNRLDRGIIQRGLAAQPVSIGDIRRRAVTAAELQQTNLTRARLALARTEVRQLGRVVPRIGRLVSPDAEPTGIANQLQLFAGLVAPLIAQRLGGAAGAAVGVGLQGAGLAAEAAGVQTGATIGGLVGELSTLNRNMTSLVNLLGKAFT